MIPDTQRLRVTATDSKSGQRHTKEMTYAEYQQVLAKKKKDGKFIYSAVQIK
jgi:hypothetical protein